MRIRAVYLGILDKPPMLRGASLVAAAVMPVFEFILYRCLILSVASSLQSRGQKYTGFPHGQQKGTPE